LVVSGGALGVVVLTFTKSNNLIDVLDNTPKKKVASNSIKIK
jgi:hypothetical protein